MNPSDLTAGASTDHNAPNTLGPTPSSSTATTTSAQPTWPAQMSIFSGNNSAAGGSSNFLNYSATTAAILERLHGKGGHATASAAFEAKKAEIMQNYATSDKLPTPPPIINTARRGRGGRIGTPSGLKTEVGASPGTTASTRGSGSGRGRGKGRKRGGASGGRGGKRKRKDSDEESEDDDDDDDSDVSDSYTPLPTRTKSGRSVNKPVAFVPTLPEPSTTVKRRKSTKTLLAAKCKTCHRETEPSNNRIVFCDACSTAYHQYCHVPSISNEVVNVLEKEWLCTPCLRSKHSAIEGADSLVAAEDLSIDEKRAYFSSLPQSQLVGLLLTAVIRHPELPIFPPDLQSQKAVTNSQLPNQLSAPPSIPQNGVSSSRAQPSKSPSFDPAGAQLLAESGLQPQGPSSTSGPRTTIDMAGHHYDEDDGYDTDPPAHYPKAGNGLAKTLRPESEDLNWLVDDNFEVFSHGWKGDGSGIGADGVLES